MKKTLFWVLLGVTNFVYGQDYRILNATTSTRSTHTMVWNSNTKEFDFVDNNDLTKFSVDWEFVLDTKQETGTITANNVVYNVSSIKASTLKDGSIALKIQAVSTIRYNEVLIVLTRAKDESLFVGLFDEIARKSYYFN
jgi:hypothetical protein